MAMLIRTDAKQSFWIDVDGSKFLVRPLTSSEDDDLAKKHTKRRPGKFPEADTHSINVAKFRRMVLDWKDVEDVNGKDVPYSEDMKKDFAEFNPDQAARIIRQAEQHDVDTVQEDYADLGKQSSGDNQEP